MAAEGNTEDSSDGSWLSMSIGDKDGPGWPVVMGAVAAAGSLVVAMISGMVQHKRDRQVQEELWASRRRFDAFKADLEDRQRRLVRFENVQELMAQYKKPLLQSAFDLQSRLANQVKQAFLHIFCHQRDNKRDLQYARFNFCFVIAEFLGWLEVIRQEIVFIAGGAEDSSVLSGLVDAIKFAFTGETPIQGVPPRGKAGDPMYDLPQHAPIMQLYAGELRAIGEVMLEEATDTGGQLEALAGGGGPPMVNQNLNVIGYAEFVRRMSKCGVPKGAGARLKTRWETQERFMQRSLAPLLAHVDALAALPKGEAPTRRLALLQVLLCRLVEMLDSAVPWDAGPAYDLEAGEEPRYIPRDFRLTPLVAHLSAPQREWLASQPFMSSCDAFVDDPLGDWACRLEEEDDVDIWRKLCFCGLREDLAPAAARAAQGGVMGSFGPQRAREKAVGADAWPGCFPPRLKRFRPLAWYYERGLAPPVHVWVHTTPGGDSNSSFGGSGGKDGKGGGKEGGKEGATGKRRTDNRLLLLSPSIMAAENELATDAATNPRALLKNSPESGSMKQSRWNMLMVATKNQQGNQSMSTRNMSGVARGVMATNGQRMHFGGGFGSRNPTDSGQTGGGGLASLSPQMIAQLQARSGSSPLVPPRVPSSPYVNSGGGVPYGGGAGYGPDPPEDKKKGVFASMLGAIA